MLPLCILADSDIDEEELKPVILKIQKKLRKAKKRKRASDSVKSYDGCLCNQLEPHRCISGSVSNPSDSGTHEDMKVAGEGTDSGHTTNVTLRNLRLAQSDREKVKSSDVYTCLTCTCNHAFLAKRQKLTINGEFSKERNSIRRTCDRKNTENTFVCGASVSESVISEPEANAVEPSHITIIDPSEPANLVALDCEFVGVGPRKTSALGRCSIVDFHGNVILDIYALPDEDITDYRTRWSGIRKKHMLSAVPFKCARAAILSAIKDKIVIGHALFNDFNVLNIQHPWGHVRDTANYKPLRMRSNHGDGQRVSLKRLTKALLDRDIQTGEHCSSEDARAALDLYKLVQSEWEEMLLSRKARRCHRTVTVPPRQRSLDNYSKSYLGDEFWPSHLFELSGHSQAL
ncbi:apoptosis-enhancing nuclease-like [Liolophura sinensis]|uniref:apoptosis-enhancing nuclease-like n=1 Tax=Liolophura sinensis TaxID=3198878 RepID=UPI0031586E01